MLFGSKGGGGGGPSSFSELAPGLLLLLLGLGGAEVVDDPAAEVLLVGLALEAVAAGRGALKYQTLTIQVRWFALAATPRSARLICCSRER